MYLITSSCKLGHQNLLSCTLCSVWSIEKWDPQSPSWLYSMIALLFELSRHILSTLSRPCLYKHPKSIEYLLDVSRRSLDLLMFSCACNISKERACKIGSAHWGAMSTWKSATSRSSSYILVGASPLVILDKWSSYSWYLPGFTQTMHSNSKRITNHQMMRPVAQGLFTKYRSTWWSTKNINLFARR